MPMVLIALLYIRARARSTRMTLTPEKKSVAN